MASAEKQVRDDPYGAHNFTVEIDEVAVGFAEVAGLGCEFDYSNGGEEVVNHVNDVTLRRGMTGDDAVWSWVRNVIDKKADVRTVTVRLMGDRGEEVCSWVLGQARLRRWSGPTLNAIDGKLAIEEIVLTAETMKFNGPR